MFLVPAHSWKKVSESFDNRGYTPTDNGLSAAEKMANLEMMLGQIANFGPIISRNFIIYESSSLPDIWDKYRLHFGFKITGASFVDFSFIKHEPLNATRTYFSVCTSSLQITS